MLETKIFRLSMAISASCHAFVLVGMVFAQVHEVKKPIKAVEIVYTPAPATRPQKSLPRPEIKPVLVKADKHVPQIVAVEDQDMSGLGKAFEKGPGQLSGAKKEPVSFASLEGKKVVSIPLLNSEKLSSPRYTNYHDRIRDKIRNRAYFFADDPAFQEGEVCLSFVLQSDGNLKEIKIINDKTHANDFLRSIGLRSVQESSPFPPFPADLRYPELPFNVVISFKMDN
jgi:outer membrane biosynthesis protein TonB